MPVLFAKWDNSPFPLAISSLAHLYAANLSLPWLCLTRLSPALWCCYSCHPAVSLHLFPLEFSTLKRRWRLTSVLIFYHVLLVYYIFCLVILLRWTTKGCLLAQYKIPVCLRGPCVSQDMMNATSRLKSVGKDTGHYNLAHSWWWRKSEIHNSHSLPDILLWAFKGSLAHLQLSAPHVCEPTGSYFSCPPAQQCSVCSSSPRITCRRASRAQHEEKNKICLQFFPVSNPGIWY